MEYLAVFEKAIDGTILARVPDLSGCYSVGETIEEAKENIKEAIKFHIDGLKEEGLPVPQPSLFTAELVHVFLEIPRFTKSRRLRKFRSPGSQLHACHSKPLFPLWLIPNI